MKAVRFHRPKHVSVDDVRAPKIEAPTDAIVRVTAASICGADLQIVAGLLPQLGPFTLGHEFMGIVEEVGAAVSNLARGDRVVVPFVIACGQCFFCERGLTPQCDRSNPRHYGAEGGLLSQKGGGLFGYTDLYGGYDGGLAEYVRVPFAAFGPRKVPDTIADDDALMLGATFPAAWAAAESADIRAGDTVAVFGCGAVGITAQKAAWLKGAGRVIGIDRELYRLKAANACARSETIDAVEVSPVDLLRDMTDGRGADIAIDAVGMEPHRGLLQKLTNVVHAQIGTASVLKDCLRAVRRGGSVVGAGLYAMNYDDFPLGQVFDKGLRLTLGHAPVHKYVDRLMAMVGSGQVRLSDVISHWMKLDEAPRALELLAAKRDRCLKVVLRP
jgi:threonine dehydrogenase-like Zn-dependent dehydrogenase